MDLIVRHGFIPKMHKKVDIGIMGGKIVRVSSKIKESGRKEIDAEGGLTFPGFVDPHVHMDKSLLLGRIGKEQDFSTLEKKIATMRELKRFFTADDVKRRMIQAARMAAYRGTIVTRTHVEADPIVRFKCVQGALAARDACRDIIDIKTIAFPQEGWIKNRDGSELESRPFIREAMERGIDVVGGNVNRSVWESDPEQQVDELFSLAKQKNADIDMHLDNSDNAVAFTLPYVCRKTIEYGYQGRVTVAHIPSLSAVPDQVAHRVIDRVKEAGLSVCVLPSRIRLTRVRELMSAGVNVTCGSDNMQDAFVGVGNGDLLEAMLLLAQVTEMGFDEELERIFELGTTHAARALRIDGNYGIEEEKQADLVILEAPSVPEAIRLQPRRRAVIKRGRLVIDQGRFLSETTLR
jgi:cytosine/creatinine deaminase